MATGTDQTRRVNVEGNSHDWGSDTISTSEIRRLGQIPADVPLVEEDPSGNERTIGDDEVIQVKPGHRVGRAPRYRRGRR